MKIAILLMVFSFSSFAYDCKKFEAQVKGEIVSKAQAENDIICTYQVAIEKMQPHIFCPLSPSEIEDAPIEASCELNMGDEFYQIIVFDGERYYFD